MSNLFSGITVYEGKWSLKNEQRMDEEDKAMFSRAYVVPSEYGKSACFMLKAGGKQFIPMSNQGVQLAEGEEINMNEVVIQTLQKQGENDILRVKIVK